MDKPYRTAMEIMAIAEGLKVGLMPETNTQSVPTVKHDLPKNNVNVKSRTNSHYKPKKRGKKR